MCSSSAGGVPGFGGGSLPEDRNTRARIRDAALARFAREGIAATSLRAVARDAEVAPSHVVHYFGSKPGLRDACDQYVAAMLRRAQEQVVDDGAGLDALAAARRTMAGTPVLRYLARTLVEASAASDALVDQLVADGARYLERLQHAGVVKASGDPRSRAVLLTFMALGQLALHEQFARLTGVDVTAGDHESPQQEALAAATLELLGSGLLTPSSIEGFTEVSGTSSRTPRPGPSSRGEPPKDPVTPGESTPRTSADTDVARGGSC